MLARYLSAIKIMLLPALATCALLLGQHAMAASVSCQASMTDVNFGVVDFLHATAPASNTGTLSYQCTNHSSTTQYVNACFYLDNAPLASAPWLAMHHQSGAKMLFRLKNGASGEYWGSRAAQLPLRVALTLSAQRTVNSNLSIRGELAAEQKSLPAGSYLLAFNGESSSITWSESPLTMPSNCAEQSGAQAINFVASAGIDKSCRIFAQELDFGDITMFENRNVDAQSNISVECTSDTQYNIALRSISEQSGQFFYLYPLSGPDNVKIGYMLYQDAARTLLWSDRTNAKSAIGTGSVQLHPVYGRLAAGQATYARPGVYQDTVIVTLSF
ncbi:spore coat U domain-containing protein [Serratia microhaemolytica]|uniref:Csu type fimbrial protein n=1 Tax=Serratia microhaemolytica TaxID=2675110 RepID=UPI000FDF03CE|nr:spore coat U domain-containing protein [Serratia microhaemolytica]